MRWMSRPPRPPRPPQGRNFIEVGDPLIKAFGVEAIEKVKQRVPDSTIRTDATTAVAEILQTVARPVTVHADNGQTIVTPHVSAGITVSDADPSDLNGLLHHADIALYHAKQQPGSHQLYRDDMRMPRNTGRHGPRRRDQRSTGDHTGEVTS